MEELLNQSALLSDLRVKAYLTQIMVSLDQNQKQPAQIFIKECYQLVQLFSYSATPDPNFGSDNFGMITVLLACLYVMEGRCGEAAQFFQDAITNLMAENSYVNLSAAYFCYGHFLNKQDHPREAAYYLNAACELAFSFSHATLVSEPTPLLAMYSLRGH
jgi:hypothetical protein